jgi:hypothetical protein
MGNQAFGGSGLLRDSDGQTVDVESNGGLAVNIQDQHTRALDLRFIKATSGLPPTTLAIATVEGDRSVTVADATGFADGKVIGIFQPNGPFYYGKQIGATAGGPANGVITLDTPVDSAFTVGVGVLSADDNMAVKGDVTTQIFQIGSAQRETTVDLDITRFNGYIQSATAMDDSKFGDIATGLEYGIVLRIKDGTLTNLWNVKSNGEFGLLCFDTAYTTKPPAGTSHGFRFRNTYGGQSKHGVTIRLLPGEVLELLIQDDLTGLEVFNMMAQGHVVGN